MGTFAIILDLKDWHREKVTCVWQISPGGLACSHYRFEDSHRTSPTIFLLTLVARKLRVMVCVHLKQKAWV